MSGTAIQFEGAWQGAQAWQPMLRDTTKVLWSQGISALTQKTGSPISALYRGRLEIPGFNHTIPEQDFVISQDSEGYSIENRPEGHWPKVSISVKSVLSAGTEESVIVVHFMQPADSTVDGMLYYTRTRYALINSGRCSLNFNDIAESFEFEVSVSELEKQKLLYRAKLCRKLKYIEELFGRRFTLPDQISGAQARVIELIFRGITEGEFVTRIQALELEIPRSKIDITKPPFDGPGPWSQSVTEPFELLNHELFAGPVIIKLNQAELASPRTIRQIQEGQQGLIPVRFEILDNQITYRFEEYANEPSAKLNERLNRFKQELAQEEPLDLVELVNEPLIDDVSTAEAVQIAVGWLQYNRFPDRFCPQVPESDSTSRAWRVPVFLVYAHGEGGQVGEIFIDMKTGAVIRHTPVEEMRNRGLALAENILHAR